MYTFTKQTSSENESNYSYSPRNGCDSMICLETACLDILQEQKLPLCDSLAMKSSKSCSGELLYRQYLNRPNFLVVQDLLDYM